MFSCPLDVAAQWAPSLRSETLVNSNMLPYVNSLNAPRQGACAVLDILKLLLRGVWTGRRTCWSGCGRKSGIVCCFFPKTNAQKNPKCVSSNRELRPFGRETVDRQWQSTGCSGRTAVKRSNDSVFKLIEIWKKQKFFSHHFYFWAVRFYCRFLQGPGTDIGTGLD